MAAKLLIAQREWTLLIRFVKPQESTKWADGWVGFPFRFTECDLEHDGGLCGSVRKRSPQYNTRSPFFLAAMGSTCKQGKPNHYKKNCILRLLKTLIATVRRVANVHLRLFPNSRGCWGRNCHLRPFVKQPHQQPHKVLRQFPTAANVEIHKDFKGLATVWTVAIVYFEIYNLKCCGCFWTVADVFFYF